MTTIDHERDVFAVQLLCGLVTDIDGVEDPQMVALRNELLADSWTLLERVTDHQDAWRLRGIVRHSQEKTSEAIECFHMAVGAGDLTALIRLEALLQSEGLSSEAREISSRISEEVNRNNPDVLWALARDSALRVLEGEQSFDELVHRAAAAGSTYARKLVLQHGLQQGDLGALEQLRSMTEESDVALILARHLWRFAPGDLNDPDLEFGEGIRWAKIAHEKGNLHSTVLLWAISQPPADAEFEAVLNSRFLSGERLNHFAFDFVGRGQKLVSLGEKAYQDGDQLAALRLFQAAAFGGADGAVQQIGELLKEEAGNIGPWATLGAFLYPWPRALGLDLVGTPEFPLGVKQQDPALRDDHSAALAIDESDFARRILEVLEQVGWQATPLGDHLLVGNWSVESGQMQIYVEIAGGDDKDRFAYLSTPLLVGVSQAPWQAPDSPTDGLDGWEDAMTSDFRKRMSEVGAFTDSYEQPQRRVIEALLRLGENDSRDYYLEPLGFLGLTLGGIMGRKLTFGGAPVHLYPRAWASACQSDYFSSPRIDAIPQEHRCSSPIDTMYVGYTLSSELSGGHLRGVVLGIVHSLMAVQDYVTRMFDDEPSIFHEFFAAIPMARVHDHLDLFAGAVPDVGSGTIRTGAKVYGAMEATKAKRHETILDPDADPMRVNNAAEQLHDAGELGEEEYEDILYRSALAGGSMALCTLVKSYQSRGDFERSVRVFHECIEAVRAWVKTSDARKTWGPQLDDHLMYALTEAGITYMAMGRDQDAQAVWSDPELHSYPEAVLGLAVLSHRQGDDSNTLSLLRRVPTDQWIDAWALLDTAVADCAQQQGREWEADWYLEGQRLLQSTVFHLDTLVTQQDVDPVLLNNAAWTALNEGRIDQALIGFERAAQAGQPNALATLIWVRCQRGEFQLALRAWEECRLNVPAFMEQVQTEGGELLGMEDQIPNFTSNAALALLAVGRRQEALDNWESAAASGHLEARAYPGVLAWREGRRESAMGDLRSLTEDELDELRSGLAEEAQGEGWLADWAQSALDAIDHFEAREAAVLPERTRGFRRFLG